MRFGVDVHFAVKDVQSEADKKTGRRRPMSAPATTAKVVLKQPKTVSTQTQTKVNQPQQSKYASLIEQYKPQFGNLRKQSVDAAPTPVVVNAAPPRGNNASEVDPIETEPLKLPSKHPVKNTSNTSLSNKIRIDPKTKLIEDSSVRWDINVICEDRDLLLMAQDYKISEYNLKHHILLPESKPEAKLVASDVRVGMREQTMLGGVGRDRVEHFSVGKAVNDPMPFYPFLNEGSLQLRRMNHIAFDDGRHSLSLVRHRNS